MAIQKQTCFVYLNIAPTIWIEAQATTKAEREEQVLVGDRRASRLVHS